MRWFVRARLGIAVSLALTACGSASGSSVISTRNREEAPTVDYPELEQARRDFLMNRVRRVSAGAWHTCALLDDASVYCWGDNSVGQLGDGTRVSSKEPVRVQGLPPARDVAAGAASTCASTRDAELFCWGANSVGQLGNGERANGHTRPVRAVGLTRVWLASASTLAERNCVIVESGALACWGRLAMLGEDGRPFLGSFEPSQDGSMQHALAVAIGVHHECVITQSGHVHCRGYGPRGELGGLHAGPWEGFVPVEGIDRIVSIAVGARHGCAARADGTVSCWGDNDRAQLGNEQMSSSPTPARVALPMAIRSVVAGEHHTCALAELGSVYCWGDNTDRQLGGDLSSDRASVHLVPLAERAHELTAGARHNCALVSGGQLRCWGDNIGGQLGDGTLDDRAWPVAVFQGQERADTQLALRTTE